MKNFLGILAAVCVVCHIAFFTVGCAPKKTPVAVEHDSADCALLFGDWSRTVTAETELHVDSDEPERSAGTARFKSVTMQSFRSDRTFRTELRQEFVSFSPAAGAPAVSEAELRAFFDRTLVVSGSYAASAELLQYESVTVQLSDGTSVPYAEYEALYPHMGSAVQTVLWQVSGDTLYLHTDTKFEPVETEFRRISGD